jgi:hypothetical protein
MKIKVDHMNVLKLFSLSFIGVLVVGCSGPAPAKLSNGANIYLNKNVLAPKPDEVIPKNQQELKNRDWDYEFFAKKKGDEYFAQNVEIKIKYLAAHASLITIKGNEDVLKDYIYYFKDIVRPTSKIDTVVSDEQPDDIVSVVFTKNRKDLK